MSKKKSCRLYELCSKSLLKCSFIFYGEFLCNRSVICPSFPVSFLVLVWAFAPILFRGDRWWICNWSYSLNIFCVLKETLGFAVMYSCNFTFPAVVGRLSCCGDPQQLSKWSSNKSVSAFSPSWFWLLWRPPDANLLCAVDVNRRPHLPRLLQSIWGSLVTLSVQ